MSERGVFAGGADELAGFVAGAAARAPFGRVLMADPRDFQVEYSINPHMEAQRGAVDPARALLQWDAVRAAYEELGFPVSVCPALAGSPDLVFAANQTLPFVNSSGQPAALISNMARPERAAEPVHVAAFLSGLGYPLVPVAVTPFEGCGDALWHPGRNLLWGGFGYRTAREAWDEVSWRTGARVVPLRLADERCYHLDTCLMPLDETTALYCPAAFDDEGRARLAAGFPRLIAADEGEALRGFALNGHCPDGRTLLLPAGNPLTARSVRESGFRVVELPMDEFHKSGGSIFCVKNMLPEAP